MSLAALIFAAAAGASPVAGETPNLYFEPAGCAEIRRQVVERQREAFRRLGQLPSAGAMYAVERRVHGCAVPTPMGYHPDYVLPGPADAPAVKPADGRSRRR